MQLQPLQPPPHLPLQPPPSCVGGKGKGGRGEGADAASRSLLINTKLEFEGRAAGLKYHNMIVSGVQGRAGSKWQARAWLRQIRAGCDRARQSRQCREG